MHIVPAQFLHVLEQICTFQCMWPDGDCVNVHVFLSHKYEIVSLVWSYFLWVLGLVGGQIFCFFFCLFFKLSMLLLLFSNHSLWNPEFSRSCLIIKSPLWCFACLWHHFNKCVLTQEKLCHQYVVCHMLCSSSSCIWYIFKSSHEAKLTQTVCDNIIVLWSFQGCKPCNAKVWEVALKLTLSH